MAFFLTPRLAPAYATQCNPWAHPPRPQFSYRRVARPSFPSFVPFLSQVDELLSEIDREARREAHREAHRQRQLRKRAFRAHFNVHENPDGWQVDAEVPDFEQENFEIQVTDENTLRVAGNTERKAEQPKQEAAPAIEAQLTETTALDETMEGVTLNEPEEAHSDTESHKSYQATVEDDFEDLGAETASTLSAGSSTTEEPKEPKGKEKVVDGPVAAPTETAQQPQPEAPAQQPQEDQRFHGTFERTFRFAEKIDAAGVTASFKNGLLSITVPRAKAPEVRKVLIQ